MRVISAENMDAYLRAFTTVSDSAQSAHGEARDCVRLRLANSLTFFDNTAISTHSNAVRVVTFDAAVRELQAACQGLPIDFAPEIDWKAMDPKPKAE